MKPRDAVFLAVLTIVGGRCCSAAEPGNTGLKQGDAIPGIGTITRIEALPYVQSDYTARFRFDTYDNPKLKELRQRYRLDEVIAPGKDEFQKQLLLLDWVNHRFKRFGKPDSPARGALEILEANDGGHAFFCAHYADVFVSAAASLGWIDRPLALRRADNMGHNSSTEHSSTEIWSNQFRKWIMLDPTFAMYVENRDGLPLSAYELRQEWFYRDGRDLVFVLDKDHKRYRKADMPVFRGRYAGFGDLVLDESAINPYAFIGYIPNNDLMNGGPDYGKMFITQDKLCEGTKWHKRIVPADPTKDPYFPMGQAAVTLTAAGGGGIRVGLKTMTPNFEAYMARIDGGEWKAIEDGFGWKIHSGVNQLEVKTVNQFGVEGPVSMMEVRAN
jgi:hypothetical protein